MPTSNALPEMLAGRRHGTDGHITGIGGLRHDPNGKFAWILDPDGTKIELWQSTKH